MELTKEQIEFLDRVCYGRKYCILNPDGEVDVDGGVDMGFMNLTEIPVKFGSVRGGSFVCSDNQLTSLKNSPTSVGGGLFCSRNKLISLEGFPIRVGWDLWCSSNPLTNYFKNIKEEDFPHWDKLNWDWMLKEYPFLINICKKYRTKNNLKGYLNYHPQTKIYLK